jgi:cyclophilin family peptidyl-prolyl cis-trans isomerase
MAHSQALEDTAATLLGTLATYISYIQSMKQAEKEGTTPPTGPTGDVIVRGMQIHRVVKRGMQQHGDEYEQNDMSNFEREPLRYQDFMVHILAAVASREPEFAQELHQLAEKQG